MVMVNAFGAVSGRECTAAADAGGDGAAAVVASVVDAVDGDDDGVVVVGVNVAAEQRPLNRIVSLLTTTTMMS